MKKNVLQNIIGFVLKYIWIFCGLLIILELISVTYTASILMKQSAIGMMQSVSGEISGRVDGTLRLLNGIATDSRFSDTEKPLFDRAIQALPYQKSYNLYMIALTDEDVNVVSADEIAPSAEPYSLSYRDYMQRLYKTGEYQITDAFLSGDNKNTLNYTIAVPIMKDDKVAGSVFGSIYFDDIESTLSKQSENSGRKFYLFGRENTIMAGDAGEINGFSFLDLSEKSHIFGKSKQEVDADLRAGKSGEFWQWDSEGLIYVIHQRVAPTEWTILYRVHFATVFANLIPVLCVKIFFFILMCVVVYLLGKRYLSKHLAQVNHLINRMSIIQKELFQSEQPDFDNLLDFTQQSLTDQLTGLSTRVLLFNKMVQFITAENAHGAVMFIDLDDLKYINDNYGHEGGDLSLAYFGQVLKQYEQEYNAVAARYGGDEFVFLLDGVKHKEACVIAEKLCHDLNTVIVVKEKSFNIHASIGVSFYPDNATKPEELICKADLALYAAKQEGKNQCEFFTEGTALM